MIFESVIFTDVIFHAVLFTADGQSGKADTYSGKPSGTH